MFEARIFINGMLGRSAYVFWEIPNHIQLPAGAILVERAFSPASPNWVTLDPIATSDTFALDAAFPVVGRDPLPWYRLRHTSSANVVTYSTPVEAYAGIPAREYRQAKEITRRKYLGMIKGSGRYGFLRRRRTWGAPCPDCLDTQTGKPTNPHCRTCFGTGYDRGYFDPVQYWIQPLSPTQRHHQTDTPGQTTRLQFTAEALPYPIPQYRDLWVSGTDGRIYVINGDEQPIQPTAELRGIPLSLTISLAAIDTTDIVYAMSQTGVSSGAQGTLVSGTQEYRAGAEIVSEATRITNAAPVAAAPDTRPVF